MMKLLLNKSRDNNQGTVVASADLDNGGDTRSPSLTGWSTLSTSVH